VIRAVIGAAIFTWAVGAIPLPAQADPQPSPVPVSTATPDPLSVSGFARSYYFTRQNASNNPGAQFNFSSSKYSSTGVNQATWTTGVGLHADYTFPDWGGWYVGGTYLYSNPLDGPCSVGSAHAKGKPCVSQAPPNTNPDDTLPGFSLSTLYEAYVGYKTNGLWARAGDMLFASPWVNPADTRIKPAAFQGGDFIYTGMKNWTFEAADMLQFQNRTSSTFGSNTLLTSFPAGAAGLAANIYNPGGGPIETSGFLFGKVGYAYAPAGLTLDGYLYGVTNLMTMWWFDGKYYLNQTAAKPFVAMQGGLEKNAGFSYIGKIDSQVFGAQIGANATKNLLLTFAFDALPWRTDTIALPKGVSCSTSTNQITAKGATLAYFLPLVNNGTGQCSNNANGTVNVYYGGWASPYTDSYTADPLYTTNISQGMAERRAAVTSEKFVATFTSNNKRLTFLASYGWFDYGNGAASSANTQEWDLDGIYRFSPYKGTGVYKGLMLRDRYMNRTIDNTFCGAANTNCVAGSASGTQYLGGLPLFKYNRAQVEYDF
jgi:hypothetical protein